MRTVSLNQLKILEELGSGGFGKITKVEYQGGFFALKAPKAGIPSKDVPGLLRDMQVAVEIWESLPEPARSRIESQTVWPTCLVTDGGVVHGCLMPLIPSDYFHAGRAADGSFSARERALPFFNKTSEALRAEGLDDSEWRDVEVRLAVLSRLAHLIADLHEQQLVYGDISMRNFLFAVNPPRVLAMDCDGIGRESDSARRQPHTPFFNPPEGVKGLQTRQSDVYKLALCLVRGVRGGDGSTQRRSTTALKGLVPEPLRILIDEALSQTPSRRPPARAVADEMARTVNALCAVPVIHSAALTSHFVLDGHQAELSFAVEGARNLELVGPPLGSHPVSVAGMRTFRFFPVTGGPLSLVASNRFGQAHAPLGELHIYRLPDMQLPRVPIPQSPSLRLPVLPPSAPLPELPHPALPPGPNVWREPASAASELLSSESPKIPYSDPPFWGASDTDMPLPVMNMDASERAAAHVVEMLPDLLAIIRQNSVRVP